MAEKGVEEQVLAMERLRTEEHLPSKARVRFYKKDRLYIQTSGGGGWGNPLERDKKALKCDVKDGLISQERAEKEYGGC